MITCYFYRSYRRWVNPLSFSFQIMIGQPPKRYMLAHPQLLKADAEITTEIIQPVLHRSKTALI